VIAETASSQDGAPETRVIAGRFSALDAACARACDHANAEQSPRARPPYAVHVQRSAVEALARTSRGPVQRLAAGITSRIRYGARTGYHLDWAAVSLPVRSAD
jgi:hypothetical protein